MSKKVWNGKIEKDEFVQLQESSAQVMGLNKVKKEAEGNTDGDRLDTYEQIWNAIMKFMRVYKDEYGWFEWSSMREDPIGVATRYKKRGDGNIARQVLKDLKKQGYITITRIDELNNWDLLDLDGMPRSARIAVINKVDNLNESI